MLMLMCRTIYNIVCLHVQKNFFCTWFSELKRAAGMGFFGNQRNVEFLEETKRVLVNSLTPEILCLQYFLLLF